MITVEKAREIDPEALKDMSDEQVQQLLDDQYGLAELAFEMWIKDRSFVERILNKSEKKGQ